MPKGVSSCSCRFICCFGTKWSRYGCCILDSYLVLIHRIWLFQDFVVAVLQTPLEGLGDTLELTHYIHSCVHSYGSSVSMDQLYVTCCFFIGNVLTAEQQIAFEAGEPLPLSLQTHSVTSSPNFHGRIYPIISNLNVYSM